MNKNYPDSLFDEDTLKNAISCAVLMSSIDGEIHEKEWQVIQSFVDKYWQEEYKAFSRFQVEIKKEIESVFKKEASFQAKLDHFAAKLTDDLDSEQKNIVLNLIGDVMVADGVMTLGESKLFSTLMEKLGIRIN